MSVAAAALHDVSGYFQEQTGVTLRQEQQAAEAEEGFSLSIILLYETNFWYTLFGSSF